MTEKLNDKAEKTQVEGIIKEDRVIISDPEAIQEFYYSSYIGELDKEDHDTEKLSLNPVEVLLLSERKRLLIFIDNDNKNDIYDFEGLLTNFSQYDDKLWHKYIILKRILLVISSIPCLRELLSIYGILIKFRE